MNENAGLFWALVFGVPIVIACIIALIVAGVKGKLGETFIKGLILALRIVIPLGLILGIGYIIYLASTDTLPYVSSDVGMTWVHWVFVAVFLLFMFAGIPLIIFLFKKRRTRVRREKATCDSCGAVALKFIGWHSESQGIIKTTTTIQPNRFESSGYTGKSRSVEQSDKYRVYKCKECGEETYVHAPLATWAWNR